MIRNDLGSDRNTDLAGQWSDKFEVTIRGESKRSKAILASCYLEETLRNLLLLSLVPIGSTKDALLDGPQAPLGNFNAKIDCCYRMGLISKDVSTSLHLVRKIRNRFAHTLSDCSFEDSEIKDRVAELHRLNDVATTERRATFSSGSIGDFEKSVSFLVFYLQLIIQKTPDQCPSCGEAMPGRQELKERPPD